jgi:hypothetical protein
VGYAGYSVSYLASAPTISAPYTVNSLSINTPYTFRYLVVCNGGAQMQSYPTNYTTCNGPARLQDEHRVYEYNGVYYVDMDMGDIAAATDNSIGQDGEVRDVKLNDVTAQFDA